MTRREALQAAVAAALAAAGVGMGIDEAHAVGGWDVVCGQCGNVCCPRCTADGNLSTCAQTRFGNCAVCKHPSSNHARRPSP